MTKILADLAALKARIEAIATYVPLVNETVQQVESLMPGAPGQSKAQTALNIVLTIAHAGENVPNATVQIICSLIDTAVAVFNSLGLFKKANAPASVTVAGV